MAAKSLGNPPTTVEEIVAQEKSLTLDHFTAEDAFEIGVIIRNRLRDVSEKPAIVDIALANSQQVLFRAASRSGIVPDNDNWVRRKRNYVLRFGSSTWAARHVFNGDEEKFKAKFQLGERVGDYAIHGGGFPLRVRGVEGIVGAIVVSGLAQAEDHQIIVEGLQEFLGR